jgi:hypothetical protein
VKLENTSPKHLSFHDFSSATLSYDETMLLSLGASYALTLSNLYASAAAAEMPQAGAEFGEF